MKKKLWIDTDVGVDDSLAILLCLNSSEYEIVGISCCGGNASLKNVIHNVNRTLNVWGHDSQKIPIYGGCTRGLIEKPMVIPEIHGDDGLGDINDKDFGIDIPDRIEKENAINALIEACQRYDDLYLLTLAPLTNIALALRMNLDAMLRLKHITIMGGAEDGVGNTSPYAEFNFRADPHAAYIVFTTFPQERITMSTWTLTTHHQFKGEKMKNICDRHNTLIEKFVAESWKKLLIFTKGCLLMADPHAAFVALYGYTKVERLRVTIVTEGEKIGMTEVVSDPNGTFVPKELDETELIAKLEAVLTDH